MNRMNDARESLLEEGLEVLRTSGYPGLEIKMVTAACGMATGTFYNYFKSKREFALTILEADCAQRVKRTEEILALDLPLRDKLRMAADAYRDYRKEVGSLFWQIPMEPHVSDEIMTHERERARSLAMKILNDTVDHGDRASAMVDERIISYVVQYLTSESTLGGVSFEDFFSCLSMLLERSGAQQPSDDQEIEELRRMGSTIPGAFGIYRVRSDALETVYASPELPGILGMGDGEYATATSADAMDIILEQDHDDVLRTMKRCVAEHTPVDIYYRVRHRDFGFDWVRAQATVLSEDSTGPVLFATFSNASVDGAIYQEILDSTGRQVFVCDRGTHEILFANHPARERMQGASGYRPDMTCFAVKGESEPCEGCFLDTLGPAECLDRERYDKSRDRWERLTGHFIDWCGHAAFVMFIDDITELKRALDDAIKHRRMYEAAIEDARLVVWEYDVINHRILMSDNDFTRYDYRKFDLPKVVDNAPWSLTSYIDDDYVDTFLDMYRRIDEGEPKASCEVWYKFKPGQEPRCMRISYTTAFDDEGKPVTAFGIGQNITARKNEERQFNNIYNELAKAIPDSLGTFRLNLTKDICGNGQSPFPSVLKQQESGTIDGYFAESARIIATAEGRARFLSTFSREKMLEAFHQGETKISLLYPIHIPLPAGPIHWIEGTISMLQNPVSGDVEAVTTGIDVTEHRYTDMMVEAFSREIFEFAILVDAEEGVILSGGEIAGSAAHFSGRAYADAIVDVFEELLPEDVVAEALFTCGLENVKERLENSPSFEAAFSTRDQRYLRWHFTYANADRTTILITREDVTEAFRQEQDRILELENERRAHQHTSALLKSILDTAPVAMFWKDTERRFEGANRAFLDFYGFDSLDAILGKNDEDMGWHPDPGPYHDDELRVVEEGVSTRRVPGECVAQGKIYHIVASKSPRHEDGRIVGLVGNFEDVTREYERAEEISTLNADLTRALSDAERANAAEQAFLANMSHDMRTPLNGVLGFTELALNTDDMSRKQDYLKKIDNSGKLMLDLVNDVLDLSKIESGKMELLPQVFDAHGLFNAVLDEVRLSAEQRGLVLESRIDEKYPSYIQTDRLRNQQIALNLLTNAIKYTPDGGRVSFSIEYLDPPSMGCNTLMTVSDDGIGMSGEFQKRMFEPFSQEHQSRMYGIQGTGLGLSIVKRIVDLMGGHIEVESELDHGSTFRVYLPVIIADVEGSALPSKDASARGIAGKRILICEDNALNAEIAETILRERGGASVECARDGAQGVAMFKSSDPGYFDAILMDVRMPVENGIQATCDIRRLDRADACGVPIVAMTADAFTEDMQNCRDAGMNGYVSKPVRPDRLINVLAAVMDGEEWPLGEIDS